MNSIFGKIFDFYISKKVGHYAKEIKKVGWQNYEYDSIYTDTFSELLDKLIIVHIKYWNYEDEMNDTKDKDKIVDMKRKSEILFKEKRPMLLKAIDKMFFNTLNGKTKYSTENLKKYKGWDK